ncbi:hypothetical protein C4571_03070 [Candidatus Parcubacteria bacterium]|nr:MAG: hypothetical protein C4571_03070 [Candidatus Parcubacteria bacterium]
MNRNGYMATAVLALTLVFSLGFAQEAPLLLISWRALTYVPPGFSGKALPIENSVVEAAVELVDRGSPINTAGYPIYWYLNGKYLEGGRGLRSVKFPVPRFGDRFDLRAEISGYKGASPTKTVRVPVVRPEAVISTPLSGNNFSSLSTEFRALPYFFNVTKLSDLVFRWRVNDEAVASTENPDGLTVNLDPTTPPGFKTRIELSIQNPRNVLEGDANSLELTFVK